MRPDTGLALLVLVSGCSTSAPMTAGVPDALRDTGLYANWDKGVIDSSVRAYAPGYEAWSDGAGKTRWIYLPPGTTIDVSDANAWVFPAGTKLWKEFRLPIGGVEKRVETRFEWKDSADHWTLATYVWSDDQHSATRATQPIQPFAGTASYEVPAGQCTRCHAASAHEKPLGFSAVMLSAPRATGLTFDALVAARLVSSSSALPARDQLRPLSQAQPVEQEALGYLHANCGVTCHRDNGEAPFSLRLDIDMSGSAPQVVEATAAFATINHLSSFVPSGSSGLYYRIRPGDVARITIAYRMGLRDDVAQMPPIATHVVDEDGLARVQSWIGAMTAAPYPLPAPLE